MSLSAYRIRPPELVPQESVPGAFPGTAPGVIEPVPIFYPAGEMDYAFLYRQLQNTGFLGTANTWTTNQTFRPGGGQGGVGDVNVAFTIQSDGSGINDQRVLTQWGANWQVGTHIRGDNSGSDMFWYDTLFNRARMVIDSDGQLSLFGYATLSGVPYANHVNTVFNMECRANGLDAGVPVPGFGVGMQFRVPDANSQLFTGSAFNCILDAVTAGVPTTHLDAYVLQAGSVVHVAAFSPNNLGVFADGNPSTVTSMLTFRNGATPSAIGAGTMIDYLGFDGGGNFIHWGRQVMTVTDATSGAANTSHAFTAQHGGTEVEVLRVRGAGMAATNAGGTAVVTNVGGEVSVRGNLSHLGTALGFYGATTITKPAVSGSRGGNAALASLLSQLATLGLITDSSS